MCRYPRAGLVQQIQQPVPTDPEPHCHLRPTLRVEERRAEGRESPQPTSRRRVIPVPPAQRLFSLP